MINEYEDTGIHDIFMEFLVFFCVIKHEFPEEYAV
jgi:hypothetical protein